MKITTEENIKRQLLRKDLTLEQKEKFKRLLVDQDGYDIDEIRGYDYGEGIGQNYK